MNKGKGIMQREKKRKLLIKGEQKLSNVRQKNNKE
jgi:hypothetical protein